jgi:VanZ family protein
MTLLRRASWRKASFLLWCLGWLVVVALLLSPLDAAVQKGGDKVAHLLVFAALAFGTIGFCRRPRCLASLAAVTLCAGGALEAAQALVPYRTVEIADALANASGAALGFLAALAVLGYWSRYERVAARRAT